jgi:hypothetical protein
MDRLARASHPVSAMESIERTHLAAVTGGMRWDQFRRSDNIEDDRELTPEQSMNRPVSLAPPLKYGPRTPNDLPHQAGLDDIGKSAGSK